MVYFTYDCHLKEKQLNLKKYVSIKQIWEKFDMFFDNFRICQYEWQINWSVYFHMYEI